MKIPFLYALAVIASLSCMTGCVGYVSPSSPYAAPPVLAPYGGYNYGVYPVIPPVFIGNGWGYEGYGFYRHH